MAKTIGLVSCDGVKFSEIDVELAAECKKIKHMLQSIVGEEETNGIVLTLKNVSGDVLKVVLEWLKLEDVKVIIIILMSVILCYNKFACIYYFGFIVFSRARLLGFRTKICLRTKQQGLALLK